MTIQTFTLPGTEAVLKAQPKARENFVVTDVPGFADYADQHIPARRFKQENDNTEWYAHVGFTEGLQMLRQGDLASVPASDKLLNDMDKLVPVSHAFRTYDSVVGAVPNVPQYLAGNPYNMRTRKRVASVSAPLAVIVELVASGGIDAEICRKRGVVMLALVRALANIRPVELWTVIAIGQHESRSSICIRLDTTPLDLARAAHVLTHPSVFRGCGYDSLRHAFYDGRWNGEWAFGDVGLHKKTAAESYKRVLNPGSDVLFIPPVHLDDQYLNDPKAWLVDMLAKHGGIAIEEVA